MAIVFTQIDIAAKPDDIWTVLTDYDAYPRWNPLMKSIARHAENALTIHLHPRGQWTFSFEAVVMETVALKHMRWQGQCGWRGWLDWNHDIEIEAAATFCTLRQTARFTGYLIKPTPNFMMTPVRNGFARMNEAVRDLAEAGRRGR